MDRFFAFLLVLDLASLLIWEIIGGIPGSGVPCQPEEMVPKKTLREREAMFLERIGDLPILSPGEKEKIREIACEGDPQLEMISVEIMTRFPDQHRFVMEWLHEQDSKILQLVRQRPNESMGPLPPQFESLLAELNASPSDLMLSDSMASSAQATQADLIPEFAEPDELFQVLQNLSPISDSDEMYVVRAKAMIEAGLQAIDPFLRGAAVMAVSRLPLPDGAEQIRNMLEDPSDYVRGCAVAALCELEQEAALPELNQLLDEEGSEDVLEIILISLARIPQPETIAILDRNMENLPKALQPTASRVRRLLADNLSGHCTPTPPPNPLLHG